MAVTRKIALEIKIMLLKTFTMNQYGLNLEILIKELVELFLDIFGELYKTPRDV